MNVARRSVRWSVGVAGVLGWSGTVFLAVLDIARPPGSLIAPGWMAAMSLCTAVAIAATVCGLLLHTLPTLYATWRDGIDYGRRCEREDAGLDDPVLAPVRELRSVR